MSTPERAQSDESAASAEAVTPAPESFSPIDADAAARALGTALDAIAGAADLDELKAVRIAQTGDRSPLALANREIGKLAPADKATAGKVLGPVRARIGQALAARQVVLEAERDARVLVEEAVDVTVLPERPVGARHPLTTISERVADVLHAPLADSTLYRRISHQDAAPCP